MLDTGEHISFSFAKARIRAIGGFVAVVFLCCFIINDVYVI